jgi:CBS domain-containing protein
MKPSVAKVADLLKRKSVAVRTIKPTETIEVLSHRLQEQRLGAMIVSRDGESVDGIISERDVAYGVASHPGNLSSLPVSALMTNEVVTCSPDDTLAEVSKVMAERHIRHLPVADGKRLAGIISMRDVFMHRADEVNRLAELVTGY